MWIPDTPPEDVDSTGGHRFELPSRAVGAQRLRRPAGNPTKTARRGICKAHRPETERFRISSALTSFRAPRKWEPPGTQNIVCITFSSIVPVRRGSCAVHMPSTHHRGPAAFLPNFPEFGRSWPKLYHHCRCPESDEYLPDLAQLRPTLAKFTHLGHTLPTMIGDRQKSPSIPQASRSADGFAVGKCVPRVRLGVHVLGAYVTRVRTPSVGLECAL